MPLAGLHVYSLFGEVSNRIILILLRSYGAVAGCGCLLLTYLRGRRLYGLRGGIVASLFLVTSPVFLRWSVESHPDLPQLLCVCAFLWAVFRLSESPDLRVTTMAACFAGLAFNVKYVGLFLLPTLWLAIPLMGNGPLFVVSFRNFRQTKRWKILLSSLAVFGLVVAVTNPYALIKFDAFVTSLEAERSIMSFGHSFRGDGGALRWASQLGNLLGWVNVLVLLATADLFLRRPENLRSPVVVLLFWCLTYFSYLVVFFSLIRARHLLRLMPALGIFCGGGYSTLIDELSNKAGKRGAAAVLVAALVIAFFPNLRSSWVTLGSKIVDRED